MLKPIIIVVGRQFSDFASDHSVLTISDFLKRVDSLPDDTKVIIGQGISHEQSSAITLLDRLKIEARDKISNLETTHKHHVKNVLITQPRKVRKGMYSLQLSLNDEMDRLIDHVTGYHMAGMIFIEAARQALVASTEIEYDLSSEVNPRGFTWNDCKVNFTKFAFPVPTDMELIITEEEGSAEQSVKCLGVVIFRQAGDEVCKVRMGYSLIPSQLLKKIEMRMAKKIISNLTSNSEKL